MKYFNLYLLILSSMSSFGQVVSVEPFPESINDKSASNIGNPSMSDEENRLCFKKTINIEKLAIMISDKNAEGKWSDPYPAIELGAADVFLGCAISPDGNQIYFSIDNDLYRIEYLNGKWGERQLIGAPVSTEETMDAWPSLSRDGQTLSFLRNVRTLGMSDWLLMPFMSQRTEKQEWAAPRMIVIKELKTGEEVNSFYYDSKNKYAFFASGSSQKNWGNYYGVIEDGVCRNVKKVDFKGGYITWMNKDYTSGLVLTATNPSRIATIKFSTPVIDPASLVNKKK